jgi:hypothetical protein
MSDFPPSPMPPGFGPPGNAGPYTQSPSPRPTVVTVLAIIGIVWGVFCVLSLLFNIASTAITLQTGRSLLGQTQAFMSHGLLEYALVSGIVGLGVAVLLIAASIASLQLKAWGRRGMLWWSWATIVLTIVGVSIAFANKDKQGMQRSMMSGIVGVTLVCPLIILIFPIWILATFNGVGVKAAFGAPQI